MKQIEAGDRTHSNRSVGENSKRGKKKKQHHGTRVIEGVIMKHEWYVCMYACMYTYVHTLKA